MDLVNDLSNDLALALFVDGEIARKLEGLDAKSFIARVEEELNRISANIAEHDSFGDSPPVSVTASH